MLAIAIWTLLYGVVVAASIFFLGKPTLILGNLSPKTFLLLLIDWRFLLGGLLALGARFIFVIINNLASKHPDLETAHLSVAALATTLSIIFVLAANYLFLEERLEPLQLVGAVLIMTGIFFVFR